MPLRYAEVKTNISVKDKLMLSLQAALSDRQVTKKEYEDSMAKAYPVAMVVNIFTVEDANERVFIPKDRVPIIPILFKPGTCKTLGQ